eukprot:scaffold314546_cov23-Tisochrysis_lutea.AAC.1
MALEGSIRRLFVHYTALFLSLNSMLVCRHPNDIQLYTSYPIHACSQYILHLTTSLVFSPLLNAEDFRYATVTCAAAIEHATTVLSQLNPDFKIVSVLKYSSQNVTSVANFFDNVVAEEVMRAGADAVVGCDAEVRGRLITPSLLASLADPHSPHPVNPCCLQEAGREIAKAFARREHYLKAIFLTWAPLHSGFVSSVGGPEAANHIFTAAHWHPLAR